MHELGLEAAEEALHGRVIIAAATPAHRAAQTMAGQKLLILAAGILHPTIRMMDQARRRLPPLDGHSQGSAG
jgi:hypothetical protein